MATKSGVQTGLSESMGFDPKMDKRFQVTEKTQRPILEKKKAGSGKQKVTII